MNGIQDSPVLVEKNDEVHVDMGSEGDEVGEVAQKRLCWWAEAAKTIGMAVICIPAALILIGPVIAITLIFGALYGIVAIVRAFVNDTALQVRLQKVQNIFRAVIEESWAVLLLALVYPINMEWFEPSPEKVDMMQIPQLFVHGYLARSSHWIALAVHRQSKLSNPQDYYINFGHPFQKIHSDYIEMLHEKVVDICLKTGQLPEFTCHSMGGRVTLQWRLWLEAHPEKKETLLVLINKEAFPEIKMTTLGTPFLGTDIALAHAAALISPPAEEMLSKNVPYKKEDFAEIPIDATCYYSPIDEFVPADSAYPRDYEFVKRAFPFDDVGHAAMPLLSRVIEKLFPSSQANQSTSK